MIELLEPPVTMIAPMVIAALVGLAGSAISASSQSATKSPVAPGSAGNQMDFGQGGETAEDVFKKEQVQQTPWMQAVGNQSATSPTGFGIQQPVDQSITMQEMFG